MKAPLLFSFLVPVMALSISAGHPLSNQPSPEPVIAVNHPTNESTLEFTDANFESKVLAADKLTLVDFWAEWCGPCRAMGPVVEDLANEYNGKVNIGKLNTDHNPNVVAKYSIKTIPTILFIKDGKVVGKTVGVHSRSKLEKMIKAHM